MRITKRSLQGRAGGFTLIEMLVVLTIISILAGLTLVGLQKGRMWGDQSACQTDINALVARIGNFSNAFGDRPPSSLADIKVKGNGVNEGNESLFAFLISRKKGGPFADDLKEDRWKNADGDEAKGADVKAIQTAIDWTREIGRAHV